MSDDKLLSALGRVAAEQAAERDPSFAGGEDPEIARRLLAPPSEASIERMARGVVDRLGTERRRPSAVAPIRRRALTWAGIASVPLAAAAALLLLVARPEAPLPSYTLSVTGGARGERGPEARAAAEPIAVAPQTEVVLLARPDARAEGSVHTATFLLRAGAPVAVPSTSEASAKG